MSGPDPEESSAAGVESVGVDPELVGALSDGIGARPPCSAAEAEAAALIAFRLSAMGLDPRTERFRSQRSFAPTYLVIFALALADLPLALAARRFGRRTRALGALSGLAAAGLAAAESGFAGWSPLRLLRARESQNVWAVIEPGSEPAVPDEAEAVSGGSESAKPGGSEPAVPDGECSRTICLVSHMDSSRCGLMFHPAVTPHLGWLVGAIGAAVMANAVAPLLVKARPGRLAAGMARLTIGAAAAIVLERELLGSDVPGANDNASGVAACLNLAAHFSANRPVASRLVVLVTGSEESGVIGMSEFLRRHDTDGWLFVNFDGVGAEAPLRVLSREGGPTGWKADPELLAAAEQVGREQPELEARPLADGSGLPYDATAVMARGGRAISVVNQEGPIPDYHWPTDTADRLSTQAFGKAVRFGAALVRRLDASGTA